MTRRAAEAYARAGVDLDRGASTKEAIGALVESTRTEHVVAGFGSFGAAFTLPTGYREPVLVSSVDGVGTKLHLAIEWGRPEVAGIDIVNHGIDDVAVLAARPLAFLDYVATGDLDDTTMAALVGGMADACRAADVALIGGETAQMPDTYQSGAWDIAGTMIGVAERDAMPDPGRVRPGDVIVGVPSDGLHTNGYSLARRTAAALGPDYLVGEGTLADALLTPHRSYRDELAAAFGIEGVHVAAHITGGGLEENVPRVLPAGVAAVFDLATWTPAPVFEVIAADQDVERGEMYRIFNMGLGLALVLAADAQADVLAAIPGSFVAGHIVEHDGAAVELTGR